MNSRVTVTLSTELLERAQVWANQSGRPLSDFLAETLEVSLSPFGDAPVPMDDWSDDDVLAASDFHLPIEDDQQLSRLLAEQNEGTLTTAGAVELRRLMAKYQQSLLRKSTALAEAVRRGLRQAPAP